MKLRDGVLGRSVTWAVKEFTKRKKYRVKVLLHFPKRGRGLGAEMCTSPEGSGLWAFIR